MATPRVWLESMYDAVPANERRNGDVAICLPPSTATPSMKIWYQGAWHLGVSQTAAITVTVVDTLGLSSLQGLSFGVTDHGATRTYTLSYNDNGTARIIAAPTYDE